MSSTSSSGYINTTTTPFSGNFYGNVIGGNFFTFNNSNTITTFENNAYIYAAGGIAGVNVLTEAEFAQTIGGNGGHGIYIENTTLNQFINKGYLLGGGGGGSGTRWPETVTSSLNGSNGGGGGGGSGTTSHNGNSLIGGQGGGPPNVAPTGIASITADSKTFSTLGGTSFSYSSNSGGTGSTSFFLNGINKITGGGGGGYGGGNGGSIGYVGGSSGGGGGGGGAGGAATYFGANGGNGGYSIYNTGTITNLYNLQGGNNVYGPLFYAGTLPTNYYITLNSTTNYGQLFCTGWGAITGVSFNNIYIDPASTISTSIGTVTTFRCVLVGNCFTSKTATNVVLLNSKSYSYSIVASTNVTVGGTSYPSFDLVMTSILYPAGYGILAASSLTLSGYLTGTNLPTLTYYIDGVNQTSTTTGIVKINKSSNYVSLYANYVIASGLGFTINSDQRIKKNIQHLNSAESLELVNTLKPASFQYVDFLKGTTIPKYGYLAQEVESVFPNLVYQNPAYIPNFFEIVSIEDSRKIVLKEKTTESLDIGTKVQFYDSQNEAVLRQVESIIDSKIFTVSESFVDGIETLFLYGQEVEDYRSIDTDQINTVLLSALQETNKKVVIQDKKIDELKQIAEDLRKDLDECISKKERI